MGFSSYNCVHCGHPALSIWAVNDINMWMMDMVVFINGNRFEGKYDGYGRLEQHPEGGCGFVKEHDIYALEEQLGAEAVWVHKACFHAAGEDDDFYLGCSPSQRANDQGYFFQDEHNMKEPV